MHNHLGVHGRREDGAAIFELHAQLGRVGQVAVMRERDETALRAGKDGLRVLDRRRSSGAVACVTDCGDAWNAIELLRHRVGHRTHGPHSARVTLLVDRNDARGLLPAMLQRVQAELREPNRVGMTVNAKDATHALDGTLRSRGDNRSGRFRHDVRDRFEV